MLRDQSIWVGWVTEEIRKSGVMGRDKGICWNQDSVHAPTVSEFALIHASQSVYHSNMRLKQQQCNLSFSHRQRKKDDNDKEVSVLLQQKPQPLFLPTVAERGK